MENWVKNKKKDHKTLALKSCWITVFKTVFVPSVKECSNRLLANYSRIQQNLNSTHRKFGEFYKFRYICVLKLFSKTLYLYTNENVPLKKVTIEENNLQNTFKALTNR